MGKPFRAGTLVNPVSRLDDPRLEAIHDASMSILEDPGLVCHNQQAAEIFQRAGCRVDPHDSGGAPVVRVPRRVVMDAVQSAPSRVILGAREPGNRLVLDADVPRVYFGTGSETNIFLDTELEEFVSRSDPSTVLTYPVGKQQRGSISLLCRSAKLCNALENVDFFIRNVNVQDEGIDEGNKDVNVFMAALLYCEKHVQGGVSNLASLPSVLQLGRKVAGGEEAFRENPVLSFIACVVKSPLQIVDDTARKVIEIAGRGVPLVISSSPQGGSTAPIQEEGMVAMINAEILAGITLTQLVNPGTPVLYGAVPVRTRLDTLHDFYGVAEFAHYNCDCVQMARRYGIPCYSSAGVADSKVPGYQATLDKVFSHLTVAQSGAQYVHYAFGLLDKTNIFCPLQAVIDDANVGMVKRIVAPPAFEPSEVDESVAEIRKIMASDQRLFVRSIRKRIRKGLISEPHSLRHTDTAEGVLEQAHEKLASIEASEPHRLPETVAEQMFGSVPGLLPASHFHE